MMMITNNNTKYEKRENKRNEKEKERTRNNQ